MILLNSTYRSSKIATINCTRCDGVLVPGHDEPRCYKCGYTDYASLAAVKAKTVMRLRAKYIGEYDPPENPWFLHIQVGKSNYEHYRTGPPLTPICPFCSEDMDTVHWPSGKLNEDKGVVPILKYDCPDNHSVMTDGEIWW